ncbi:hypothetical protein KSE_69360 [Kitasatospora setae KM-6054]|uniref:Uncharacterized protein n=1 Tax=Kitasatospora setae (strain ATCC 33774 / DSM 43861 / JCM 3304 / KCC A-0304 / NBRC 14216 / KM-6054) TaxID=452652 RepID=E4N3G0_KITSK|nr:hypothetical protein KSE_69360 [Kitasatospora setae KM-6054]
MLLAVLCSAVLLVKLPVPAGWRADLPPERMLAQPADLPADWEQRQDSRGASLLVRELVSDSATRIWADDRLQVVQTVERYHAPMLAALGADRSDASSAALPADFTAALPGAAALGGDPDVRYRWERNDADEQSVRATVRRGQYVEQISVRRILPAPGYGSGDRSPLTPAETADAVRRVDAAAARGAREGSPLPWHVLVWLLAAAGAAWCASGARRIALPGRAARSVALTARLLALPVAAALAWAGQDGGRWPSALLAGLALWTAPALLAPRPADPPPPPAAPPPPAVPPLPAAPPFDAAR